MSDRDPRPANPHRGEAQIVVGGVPCVLRPTFSALIAAEAELGPLFALVERAAAGELRLAEMTGLFWHCLDDSGEISRETFGDGVVSLGLAACAEPLRVLLGQILRGKG
jgi:hypothetical protein